MALSLRRANAVKNELVRQGVPADAIAVVGKGESQLLVPTGDQVREPQNRRVEIVIGGQMAQAVPVAIPPQPWPTAAALSALYRRNVAQSNADAVAGAALARCEAGAYDEGIPTLERLADQRPDSAPAARLLIAPHPEKAALAGRLFHVLRL